MSTITSPSHQHSLGHSEHTVLPHMETSLGEQLLRLDAGSAPAETLREETALAILAKNSVAELRFLRVDENAEEIHLSGNVRSFYHKQLAQEAMRTVAEGRRVVNQVIVNS